MNGLYLKARWIGNRWLIIVNTVLLSLLTLHTLQNPSGSNTVLLGTDGPKEEAAYYLVGGDAASFGPEARELVQLKAHIFIVPSKYYTASKDGSYAFMQMSI